MECYSSSLNVRAQLRPFERFLHRLAGIDSLFRLLVPVSVRHLHEGGQLSREVWMERIGAIAPRPVPCPSGRGIHPALTTQVQDVLHGNDAEIGDRTGGRTDHCPDNLAFVSDLLEIDLRVFALDWGRLFTPPTQGRVVVVGAGVHHSVRHEAMWKIEMAAPARETELQDSHSRHTVVLAQLINLRCDQAKVFCDEWQVSEDFLQPMEELVSGRFHPHSVDGGLLFGCDRPVGLEATKVIEPNGVVERQGSTDPRDPPVEATFAQLAPFVEWISPTLACL